MGRGRINSNLVVPYAPSLLVREKVLGFGYSESIFEGGMAEVAVVLLTNR